MRAELVLYAENVEGLFKADAVGSQGWPEVVSEGCRRVQRCHTVRPLLLHPAFTSL
jgi:hypothetical protein